MVNVCRVFAIKTVCSGSCILFSDLSCNSGQSAKRCRYTTSVVASVPENVPLPRRKHSVEHWSSVRVVPDQSSVRASEVVIM